MPSHFSTIGFPLASQEEFKTLVDTAVRQGRPVGTAEHRYVLYAPGAGVELWIQVNTAHAIVGCLPHFAGTGSMPFLATRELPDQEHQPDGSLYGWVNPGVDTEDGDYPLLIDIVDYALAAEQLALPRRLRLQVAAFAHTLRCFDNEAQYESVPTALNMAVESCIPMGLFYPGGQPKEPLEAEALYTGRVLEADMRVNPATNTPFYWISLQTLGATTLDVVADPAIIEHPPRVGGIVQGTFWLSGRVLEQSVG